MKASHKTLVSVLATLLIIAIGVVVILRRRNAKDVLTRDLSLGGGTRSVIESSAQNLPPPTAARTISFPPNESLGYLYWREWDFEDFDACLPGPGGGLLFWHNATTAEATPATGSITVPAGMQTILVISRRGAIPLLDTLNADDLQAIAFAPDKSSEPIQLDAEAAGHLHHLTGLRYLIFRMPPQSSEELGIGEDAFSVLGNFDFLQGIRLDEVSMTSAGFHQLRNLQSLRTLGLNVPNLNLYLSDIQSFHQLERLELGSVRHTISNSDVEFVEAMTSLKHLGIFVRKPTNESPSYLRDLVHLQTLVLGSYGESLTDGDGLKYLEQMPSLRTLYAMEKNIDGASLIHLAKLQRLEVLHLQSNRIDDEGMRHLSKLHSLRELGLARNPITDAGLTHLQGLTKLELLHVWGTSVTAQGCLQFQRALPRCSINSGFPTGLAPPAPTPQMPVS